MKRILFIDRDGTILVEPEDEQIDSFAKMEFLPGVLTNLAKIAATSGFELVMVSNQDGLGTKSFPEDTFWPVQNLMLKILQSEGIQFADIIIDKTMPHENSPTRKPGIALLKKYTSGKYDLSGSYVVGDRQSDVELAENLGTKSIFIGKKTSNRATYTARAWSEIYRYLCFPDRISEVHRKTGETDIKIILNLDGSGKADIKSGLGFLDHMLDLFAKHSGIDIKAKISAICTSMNIIRWKIRPLFWARPSNRPWEIKEVSIAMVFCCRWMSRMPGQLSIFPAGQIWFGK